MNKTTIIILIVIAILIGCGSFYGGLKYAESKRPNFGNLSPQERQQRFGNMAGNRQNNGANITSGEIISKDDKSLTIKLRDNGSKIIFFSDSTQISKFAAGAISDLAVGENLMITGSANSDGSITAQTIQIRPQMPVNPDNAPKPSNQ